MIIEETEGSPAESAPAAEITDEATGTPGTVDTGIPEQVQSDKFASTLAALGGLSGEQELREGIEILKEGEESGEEKPVVAEAPKPNPDSPEDVAAALIKEKTGETPEKETPEGDSENKNAEVEEVVVESPVFGGKKTIGKKEDEAAPIEFEGSEVANKYIKEKTGHDNLESLVGSSLKLQEKAEEYDALSQKAANYESVFENMPAQLYEAVDQFLKGGDWKAPITSKPNLDFTKTLDNQSEKSLVENYMPNQFTDEDWSDYKGDDVDLNLKRAMDIAINTAKSNFEKDRNEIESLQTTRLNEARENEKKLNASVDNSIEYLRKNIEGINDNYVKQLKGNLNVAKLTEMFFNKDGSFKEDAALKMVMAEDGYSMMNQYKTLAERQAETKERQQILVRTPESPKAKKKGAENEGTVSKEVQARIAALDGGFAQKTVY